MNDMIKELSNQAYDELVKETGNIVVFDEDLQQRFAELILMDVMSICEELGDKGQDGHYCVDAIRRKYFGVEE